MLLYSYESTFDVAMAKECLKEIDEILKVVDYEYCFVGGTLLGCIRHGCLMKWDDDIDLLLSERDINAILASDLFQKHGYEVNKYEVNGLHFNWFVQLLKNKIMVDLWPWKVMANNTGKIVIATVVGCFDFETTWPYRLIPFEGGTYPIPQDPIHYLDNTLNGSDWRHLVVKRVDGHDGAITRSESFAGPIHFATLTEFGQ